MLYICIPSFDEGPTVGVLLWKIRKVFQDFSREYEILVYNDASTDATSETLESYAKVLPLTVLGGDTRVGYASALATLCRTASQRTRYARRDAVITLQADFTDEPEHIPELVKRFEGGADIVVAEAEGLPDGPKAVRRMRQFAPWALRWSIRTPGVRDPFGSLRLYRVSVLRDALKAAGDKPLIAADGWAANVDLLLATTPHARRLETVALRPSLRPAPAGVARQADGRRDGALSLRTRGAPASAARGPDRGDVIRSSDWRRTLVLLLVLSAIAAQGALVAQEGVATVAPASSAPDGTRSPSPLASDSSTTSSSARSRSGVGAWRCSTPSRCAATRRGTRAFA